MKKRKLVEEAQTTRKSCKWYPLQYQRINKVKKTHYAATEKCKYANTLFRRIRWTSRHLETEIPRILFIAHEFLTQLELSMLECDISIVQYEKDIQTNKQQLTLPHIELETTSFYINKIVCLLENFEKTLHRNPIILTYDEKLPTFSIEFDYDHIQSRADLDRAKQLLKYDFFQHNPTSMLLNKPITDKDFCAFLAPRTLASNTYWPNLKSNLAKIMSYLHYYSVASFRILRFCELTSTIVCSDSDKKLCSFCLLPPFSTPKHLFSYQFKYGSYVLCLDRCCELDMLPFDLAKIVFSYCADDYIRMRTYM